MTQELLPFILLNLAGIFIIILKFLQSERRLSQLEVFLDSQAVDLTPNFLDLQERITSEAEATRKQQDSHYKNNQTVIKTLTGAVKNLPTTKDLDKAKAALFADMSQLIEDDGKVTRRRIAEVKTRLSDEEKDDQREKAAARRLAKKLEGGAEVVVEADTSLPEGTMVLRDEESGDVVTVIDVTPENVVKSTKKISKPKKKRKTSK